MTLSLWHLRPYLSQRFSRLTSRMMCWMQCTVDRLVLECDVTSVCRVLSCVWSNSTTQPMSPLPLSCAIFVLRAHANMFAPHLLPERAEDGEQLIDGAVDDGIDQEPRAVEAELGARVHDARQQEVVDL
jgi:hypothetical protein